MLQIFVIMRGIVRTLTALIMVLPIVSTMYLPDMPWVKNEINPDAVNPYITEDGDPDVSAHRSGAGIAPQNTLMAFEKVIEEISKPAPVEEKEDVTDSDKENNTYYCPVKDNQKENPNAICHLCLAEQTPNI